MIAEAKLNEVLLQFQNLLEKLNVILDSVWKLQIAVIVSN